MKNKILLRRQRIKKRVRGRIVRQSEYPRLSVFRSNKHIYAQVIDDYKMTTLVSVGDNSLEKEKMSNIQKAQHVGKALAEKMKEKKIKQVVFDRGPFAYAGRIKALADAVRESGVRI